ncbi:MAG TPA: beta-1,3-glucanase family protein [Candidatus Acidoferrales bacterium]|nr:beta-1,3-glucanase family protein [Candidatus Acidoferrales bacterium]
MLRHLFPALFLAAIVIAGCGGGGAGSTPFVSPSATPTPHAGPTTIPVQPSSSPQIISLTGGGYTLTFTLPAVIVGTTSTMSVSLASSPPPDVPAPQSKRRTGSGRVAVPSLREELGANATGLAYVSITSSADVGFSNQPGFVFTLPSGTSIPTGASTYVAFFDPTAATWIAAPLKGTASGQTVSFPSSTGGVYFQANTQYVYALVYTSGPIPTASPAPAPTASPTPVPTASPSASPSPGATPGLCAAGPAGTFPMSIKNNTSLSGSITVTAWGIEPSTTGNTYPTWEYITASSGSVATLPAAGSSVPSWALPNNGCIDLPPLVSAHVVLMLGGQSFAITSHGATGSTGGVAQPNPWVVSTANSGEINTVWDFLEYTWTGTTAAFNLDVTQVDQLGIPISFNTVNSSGTPAATALFGMKPYALTNLEQDLDTLGSPWSGLIQQTGASGVPRIFSPQHAANIPVDGAPTPAPGSIPANSPVFDNTTFWDPVLNQIWNTYTAANASFLHLAYAQFGDAYGQVDANGNLVFYSSASTSGTVMAKIAFPTTWAVFNNAGAFTPSSYTPNSTYIGRALVVAIERGTLPVPSPLPTAWPTAGQPFCGTSDAQFFYGASATDGGMNPTRGTLINWYAALMHKYGEAPTGPGLPGVGLAYAFPDDDECQGPINGLYDPDSSATFSTGEQWNVTLNPF